MTRDEVRFLLGRYGAAYDRKPPTAEVLDEWDRALRPYLAVDAHAALDRLIDTGQSAPRLAGFVAHVRAQRPPESLRVVDDPEPESLWDGPTQGGRDRMAWAKSMLHNPPTEENP